jgi:membrane protease subunit HflC
VLEDIETGRLAIQDMILEAAQERTTDLGIEILDVRFQRINYVEEVRQRVYERMISERQRIADRFRSEGQGEAQRIRGERDRDLKEIESGAYRTAQTIIGEADAEATEIFAEAYDRSPQTREFYEFLKTMETFRNTIDQKTSLILSTEGDFTRFLTSPDTP